MDSEAIGCCFLHCVNLQKLMPRQNLAHQESNPKMQLNSVHVPVQKKKTPKNDETLGTGST